MSQSYKKECMYCKQEIRMTEKLGKWYPSDPNGGIHYYDERKKQQQQSKQEPKKPELKNLLEAQMLLEGMDARLKRVEKMLFIEGATTTEQHTVR